MSKRDIIDYLGNKIGELELPDGTSEDIWSQKLDAYAATPPDANTQLTAMLSRTVSRSRSLADEIIDSFKARNLAYFVMNGVSSEVAIMKSCWVHHRLRAVEINLGGLPLTIDLMNLCISGDLETAYVVLSLMEPDDMSLPFHFLSSGVIGDLAQSIKDRINI